MLAQGLFQTIGVEIPVATRVNFLSRHFGPQMNPVRGGADKFLPAVAGQGHFFDIEKTRRQENVNVLLDRASIAMQTECDSGD